jgi:transcription antitermination factor NusG
VAILIDTLDRSLEGESAEPLDQGRVQDNIVGTPWHAAYTRHQHEKVAARILAFKGIEVFLPLYNAQHRWKDRVKKLSLPLFPCYFFFRGGGRRALDILSTPGVCSLVRSGDQIAVIPEPEIEWVRRVVNSCVTVEPHPFLNYGDRVRVISGPLTGVEGIFVRKKDRLRLILSVHLLQRSVAVEVDGSDVEFLREPLFRSDLKVPWANRNYGLGVA